MNLEDAQTLALLHMESHGLLAAGWSFKFDRATQRAGMCNRSTQTIQLSKPITELNTEVETENTILHEVAHALTPGHGHDAAWRAKCVEVGARPERCFREGVGEGLKVLPTRKPRRAADPAERVWWQSRCAAGHLFTRWQKTRPTKTGSCGGCARRAGVRGFDARFLIGPWTKA